MSDNIHNSYLKYKLKYLKLKSELKNKNMTGGSNMKLVLYKATWCGHCNNFKKTWGELKDDEELKQKVQFIEYDADKDKDEVASAKISGYPTLLLTIKDKVVEYEGRRDFDSIKNFIKSKD
jgi:thiol-disulfide isomerase/thioredoxin